MYTSVASAQSPLSPRPPHFDQLIMDIDTESTFVPDEAKTRMKEVVDALLVDATYDQAMVAKWVNAIVEDTTKAMVSMNKPFKYITTCVIMQRTGAGLHTASSCYWDSTLDGYAVLRVDLKTMYIIATVFAVAL